MGTYRPGFQWNKEQAAQGVCVTDPETVLGPQVRKEQTVKISGRDLESGHKGDPGNGPGLWDGGRGHL